LTAVNLMEGEMKIQVSNKIFLEDVPADLAGELKTRLTLKNPGWLEAKKMGRWTGNIPEYLYCYEMSKNGLILPRGFCRELIILCQEKGIPYQLMDNRRVLPDVDFTFTGKLKDFQQTAVDAVLRRDFGVLSSPTGSGKTCMGLAMIAERKQRALIVVHTRELLNQWIEHVKAFLGIPASEVGIIGGGKTRIGDKVTVALVQSLYKCASDIAPYIGHLIIDECHRTPSRTFTEAVSAVDSKYMLGLSATPYRRDGLSRLIY
jgi:superfamily II DNA or RNA helicase